jgi:ParB-like chromosome segregation protein Spo0J
MVPPADLTPGEVPEHAVSRLFPDMSETEYRDLAADIRAHGLKAPILLWHGLLIDGRHRLKAYNYLYLRLSHLQRQGYRTGSIKP